MTEITTSKDDFAGLKDNVIIITGGSSGIGLATTKLLLNNGAHVVNGDLAPPSLSHPSLSFHKTDVTSWTDLTSLFKFAKQIHPHIDHVFANAGVGNRASYLDEKLDEAGDLIEPSYLTFDINLRGLINTATLAVHHMRRQPGGGSIVVTASSSAFQQVASPDYATSKHGVLGFMRSMTAALKLAGLPIRINGIAPDPTETPLIPSELLREAGGFVQTPEDVAPTAALLMADESRRGHLIYSEAGRYWEVDEAVLLPAAESIRIKGQLSLNETIAKAMEILGSKDTQAAVDMVEASKKELSQA
ncbi:hypothetical protein Q7P37_005164 [Cladosporium fusiforme]